MVATQPSDSFLSGVLRASQPLKVPATETASACATVSLNCTVIFGVRVADEVRSGSGSARDFEILARAILGLLTRGAMRLGVMALDVRADVVLLVSIGLLLLFLRCARLARLQV